MGGERAGAGAGIPTRFWVFAAFAVLYGIRETMNGNWAQLEMTRQLGPPRWPRWLSPPSGLMVTAGRVLFYCTITVFSTVGFGDIAPVATAARVTTMVQMLGDLVVVGLVLRVMLGAVREGRERQAADSAGPADSSHRDDAGQASAPYLANQDRPGT